MEIRGRATDLARMNASQQYYQFSNQTMTESRYEDLTSHSMISLDITSNRTLPPDQERHLFV